LPYAGIDQLPEHVKRTPVAARKRWLQTWNVVYRRELEGGKSPDEAEARAFIIANSQLPRGISRVKLYLDPGRTDLHLPGQHDQKTHGGDIGSGSYQLPPGADGGDLGSAARVWIHGGQKSMPQALLVRQCDNIVFSHSVDGGARDMLNAAKGAGAIVKAIDSATPVEHELWRGVEFKMDGQPRQRPDTGVRNFATLEQLTTVGTELDFSVGSFSKNRRTANEFSGLNSKDSQSVMIKLRPGAKAVPISQYGRSGQYSQDEEFLSAGRVKVVSVTRETGGYNNQKDDTRG